MESKSSWLTNHINEFVCPHLPDFQETIATKKYFTPEEMAVIKNLWRAAKSAAGRSLMVLPGRDVFIFEILAQREKYPTLFLPQCSRASVSWFKGKIPSDCFIFDTGFVGSIPENLGIGNFKLASYSGNKMFNSALPSWLLKETKQDNKQVFPRLTMSRGLALKIESTPKYWETGRLQDGQLVQNYSNNSEFGRAANLTIEIYKDSSPSFINKRQPLGATGFLSW